MANPQKENGYAPIANEILEAVSKCKLNGTQFRILTVVWRYTYGFSRKEHELSVNFIVEATGVTKRQIQKELNNLIDENVLIEVRKATFNTTRIISFNKNYEAWNLYTYSPKTHQENKKCRGEQLDTSTGERLDTQESNIKTNIKQVVEEGANPFLFFEQNGFGTLSSFISDEFSYWIDGGFFNEPELILIEAMKETIKAGTRNLKYTFKCLESWKTRKLKTLNDVQASNKQFETQKHSRTKPGKRSLFEQGEESKKRMAENEADDTPFVLSKEDDELLPF